MNLNGNVVYNDADKYDSLRGSERATYELNDDNFYTRMSYDQKDVSIQNALFSIYTTSFIIVLLIVSIHSYFSLVYHISRFPRNFRNIFLAFLTYYIFICRVVSTSS